MREEWFIKSSVLSMVSDSISVYGEEYSEAQKKLLLSHGAQMYIDGFNPETGKMEVDGYGTDQQLGWIIDGKYANEEEVIELISMAYKEYDLDTVKRAIDYYKKNWKPKISKEKRMSMNKKVIEFENALMNNEDISAFFFDDTQENAELYSLLGNLYDTKGEVLFANYLYKRSALLGYPEGEGKLGWSYFCGYGLTVDDLNDNDIDISIHMRSDDLALFWLRKAKDDGWEDASRIIDMVKEQMSEREKKKSKTLEEMIEAAVADFGTEQIELAEAYEKGDEEKGIPVDYEEAVR